MPGRTATGRPGAAGDVPEPTRVVPEVDPLLLGPPLFAQQNRPLDAPRFTPSVRAAQAAGTGRTSSSPIPDGSTLGRPGADAPHGSQNGLAAASGPAQQHPGQQPPGEQHPAQQRPASPQYSQPGPRAYGPSAEAPGHAELPVAGHPAAPVPGHHPAQAPGPHNPLAGPGQALDGGPAQHGGLPEPTPTPARLGAAEPGTRQLNRPPLEPPQMGQLNRPLDPAAQPSPAVSPGDTGRQPPVDRPPTGPAPTATPGHATQPPTGHGAQPPTFPVAQPATGLPPGPRPAAADEAATPSRLNRPDSSPRAARPPLEPPQMGQLNRPLQAAPTDPTDAPSGLPTRAAVPQDSVTWPPARLAADPAVPAAPDDTPSGLPRRPDQPTRTDPDRERSREDRPN